LLGAGTQESAAGAEVAEGAAQPTSANTAIAMAQHCVMEVILVTSGRPPTVHRPDGATALFLTFQGLREANVRNKDTRTSESRCSARRPHACGICSASN
jgi:hypothetical protein